MTNVNKTLIMKTDYKVAMYGKSHVGTREYQQDCMHMYNADLLCAALVCDGMGGRAHGEKASQYAVDYLVKSLQRINAEGNINEVLRSAAFDINDDIVGFKDECGCSIKAGTTVVTAVIAQDGLHIMSVGDSRIYLIRNGKIKQLTKDQNYRLRLDELLKLGLIDQKKYVEESKKAEALISFLGVGEPIIVDIKEPMELLTGDIVLLCSDGLYKALSDEGINNIINSNLKDISCIPDELINAAAFNCDRGMDNTTVIVMQYI